MNTFKWYIVWVTYQEGIHWLRSRCTMQNVGLIKNTLIKNTYALIFISLKFEWMTLFCVLLSLLQSHKLIVLQSLTRYFVRVSDMGFVRHMLYSHTCKLLTAAANIFKMQIYSYVIIVLNKWGCAWWSFLGTSSLIGSWSNVIRSDNFMLHFHI